MEIKDAQEQTLIMPCNCKVYQRRLEKLQKKYAALRKNHKKLLGVTVLLADALEEFVKGDVKSEINDTLVSCCSIYPDLFEEAVNAKRETEAKGKCVAISGEETGKICEGASESEREYYEGFLARPKIPRTPQV